MSRYPSWATRSCAVYLLLVITNLAAGAAAPAQLTIEPRDVIRRSEELMAAGQHEQALKSLRFVYAQTKDPRILISIGRAYLRISNPVEASRNCRLAKTFLARDSDLLRLADKCIEESQNATVALKSPSASFQRAANNSPMTTGRTPPARINENKQSLAISMTQNAQQLIQYPSEKQPIHRRWWFWTGIATTVVAGVVVGTALTLNARRPNWPDAVVLMPQ